MSSVGLERLEVPSRVVKTIKSNTNNKKEKIMADTAKKEDGTVEEEVTEETSEERLLKTLSALDELSATRVKAVKNILNLSGLIGEAISKYTKEVANTNSSGLSTSGVQVADGKITVDALKMNKNLSEYILSILQDEVLTVQSKFQVTSSPAKGTTAPAEGSLPAKEVGLPLVPGASNEQESNFLKRADEENTTANNLTAGDIDLHTFLRDEDDVDNPAKGDHNPHDSCINKVLQLT